MLCVRANDVGRQNAQRGWAALGKQRRRSLHDHGPEGHALRPTLPHLGKVRLDGNCFGLLHLQMGGFSIDKLSMTLTHRTYGNPYGKLTKALGKQNVFDRR